MSGCGTCAGELVLRESLMPCPDCWPAGSPPMRLPWEPVEARLVREGRLEPDDPHRTTKVVRLLGQDPRTYRKSVQRWRAEGLTLDKADEVVIRLFGDPPRVLWPEHFELIDAVDAAMPEPEHEQLVLV